MRILPVLLITTVLTGSLFAETSRSIEDSSLTTTQSKTEMVPSVVEVPTAEAVSDSTAAVTTSEQPRCTLEITTVPPGAAVLLNTTDYGISPVTIPDLDTGKYTLIIKKSGFYQKKVVVTLSQLQRTPLTFELTAPGKLLLETVPDSANVLINGEAKGITPYTDSLLKPGNYIVRIEKDTYIPVTDSFTMLSGGVIKRVDTLVHTTAYNDSSAYSESVAAIKKKRLTLGLIVGTFGLFLMLILTIEGQDR